MQTISPSPPHRCYSFLVQIRIKHAIAGVESNIERFITLEKWREQRRQHNESFDRNESLLSRETMISFLGGASLVALLLAVCTWCLLSESPHVAPESAVDATETPVRVPNVRTTIQ